MAEPPDSFSSALAELNLGIPSVDVSVLVQIPIFFATEMISEHDEFARELPSTTFKEEVRIRVERDVQSA